jgi:hypothetical protein
MSVGVMKDYKLKQRNLRASHTLLKMVRAVSFLVGFGYFFFMVCW